MHKLSLVFSLALLPLSAIPAVADGVTITVTPWLAPNGFGSPSFAQAVQNQEYAISHGLSTYGAAGPTQYNAQNTPIHASQAIVTSFSSWMGVAQPGGVYANELGNRMQFGLSIIGNNSQFSISQLSFYADSSDPADGLGFFFNPGDYDYSADYEGVLKGTDGILGTADDVFVTSGPNTQLVDALYGRGSGNAYNPPCDDLSPNTCPADAAGQQAEIAAAASYPGLPYTFNGTYSIGADTGSGYFYVVPDGYSTAPEPSSLLLLATGAAGLAGTIRRRFNSTSTTP